MRCVFPACDYSANRAFSQDVTFYKFPEEGYLVEAWLEALGKPDLELEAHSAVCSRHFMIEDFLVTRAGWKLRHDAVPVAHVQVCRICFAGDCKLYPMKGNAQLDLSRPSYAMAYETLTGVSIAQHDKLPPYLCAQCANRLLQCIRFKARSLRAHNILTEIANDYGYITWESILSIGRIQNPLDSDLTQAETESEHIDGENTLTDEQDAKDNITIDVVKVESEDVFHQNILITDVRSTEVKGYSRSPQDDLSGYVKRENMNVINEDIENNEIMVNNVMTYLPNIHEDTNVNCDKANNNVVVNLDNVNKETNDDVGVVLDEDRSLNASLPSRKAEQNNKLRPLKINLVATLPKDILKRRREPDIDQKNVENGKQKGNGRLLLSYKLLSCGICYYQTVSRVKLMQHLKTHTTTKVYNCNKCYFLTKSKKTLQFHSEIHRNVKQHSCDICNKEFIHKGDLKTHLRIHTGEKPYSCDICEKKFNQQNQVKAHLKIHSGQKPFSCNLCNKAFRQKGQLQNHLRIHYNEKPYSCNVCNKAFTQRGQLQNHLRIHYNEKPYSCDSCNKSFTQRGQLQNHLQIHSNKK